MARKFLVQKWERNKTKAKFATRKYNRCNLCGRSRAYYRKFGICRNFVLENLLIMEKFPGVKKSKLVEFLYQIK